MTALLDVNVLVALFDGMHAYHGAAHEWFAQHRQDGWATCPLTENGLIRIISNPAYPGRQAEVRDAIDRLRVFRRSGGHTFWPDSISLSEESLFLAKHIQGYRQLTDIYLLALAVKNGGRLATFDRAMAPTSVAGAGPEHIAFISSE